MRIARLGLALSLLLVAPACPETDDDDSAGGGEDPTPDAAPGALTNFTVGVSGDVFELSWTNPADVDLAGAMIVIRPTQAVAFSPTDGVAHAVGEDLGDDTTVVHLDVGAGASVPVPALGAPFHFAGWAVDLAGQYSAPAVVDVDPGPGPPQDLAVTVGTDATLTWTPAADADLAGTLIVMRLGEAVGFAPAPDTTYALDEDLGDDMVVVHAGDGAEATVTLPPVGVPLHFAGWSWDEAGQWSGMSTPVDATRIDLGEQTAVLEYDVDDQTVTVVTQPRDLTLSAVWRDDPARGTEFQTPSIDLTVQNDTGRLLFNLKGVNDGQSDGTQDVDAHINNGAPGNSGPAPDVSYTSTLWFDEDKPFTYYGPESILPGGAVTRTLDFIHEVAFTGVVTVNLHFIDAPAIYGGNYGGDFVVLDSSSSGMAHHMSFRPPEGARGGNPSGAAGQNLRQGVTSADGRLLYAAEKQTPFVNVFDTALLEWTGGKDLSTDGGGSVGGVVLSPDKTVLYVLFNDGSHFHGWGPLTEEPSTPSVHVLALNASDLSEIARATLYTEDAEARSGRHLAIRPDGGRLAVAVATREGDMNELWVLDLPGLGLVDADAETEGAQPLSLPQPDGGRLEYLAYSDTGDKVAAMYNDHHAASETETVNVDLVDVATWAVTSVTPEIEGNTASVSAVRDGQLYYTARRDNNRPLTRISFADGAQQTPDLWMSLERGDPRTADATGVVFVPRSDNYWVIARNLAYPVVLATDELADSGQDEINGYFPVVMGDSMRAHFFSVSPY